MKERPNEAERFCAFVSPEPNSGCWLWLGAINTKGYGRFGRGEMAHRASLRLLSGIVVPNGQEVDHRCRVRCCVNPAHLDLVTHAENIARKPVPNTCPAGHGPEQLRIRSGKRYCRACDRARQFAAYKPRPNARRRRTKLTSAEKQHIRELISAGHSHSEIAPLLNVSVGTVSRVRNAQ